MIIIDRSNSFTCTGATGAAEGPAAAAAAAPHRSVCPLLCKLSLRGSQQTTIPMVCTTCMYMYIYIYIEREREIDITIHDYIVLYNTIYTSIRVYNVTCFCSEADSTSSQVIEIRVKMQRWNRNHTHGIRRCSCMDSASAKRNLGCFRRFRLSEASAPRVVFDAVAPQVLLFVGASWG